MKSCFLCGVLGLCSLAGRCGEDDRPEATLTLHLGKPHTILADSGGMIRQVEVCN